VLLFLGRAPAEKTRAERYARDVAGGAQAPKDESSDGPAESWYSNHPPPKQPPHDPDEEDWVPPPHAVPFGPFLALAALEVLLAGDGLYRWYFDAMERLFG